MIQLHYFPGSASMTPHMLLAELGIPFELVFVDRLAGAHKSAEYLKLNPNGLIPVLVDGSLVLYETVAICLYLADTQPQGQLVPTVGTAERAHFYKWLAWLGCTLHATLILYFYPERWVDAGNTAGTAQVKAHAETRVGALLDQLDAQFASHGGPFMLGGHTSALDPYAFMLCRWTRGFTRPARSLPHLKPFLERMLARPAVQRVLAAEALPAPYV